MAPGGGLYWIALSTIGGLVWAIAGAAILDQVSTTSSRTARRRPQRTAVARGLRPMDDQPLQDRYGAGRYLLRVRSGQPRRSADKEPGESALQSSPTGRQADHQAFPGVLSSGIIATLLDCHSNWTAAYHLMQTDGLAVPPSIVTADLAIRYVRPTPTDRPVRLSARLAETTSRGTVIDAVLTSAEAVTATAISTFVAVRPDHPAYGTR
jgi:acyl-coenzyme A thioesterase PaaI-like protein